MNLVNLYKKNSGLINTICILIFILIMIFASKNAQIEYQNASPVIVPTPYGDTISGEVRNVVDMIGDFGRIYGVSVMINLNESNEHPELIGSLIAVQLEPELRSLTKGNVISLNSCFYNDAGYYYGCSVKLITTVATP